jgi:Zn ribbon nucleic-acid-binding protein
MEDDATVTVLTECWQCGYLFRDIEKHVRESVTVRGG